jgi:hypothetical protein
MGKPSADLPESLDTESPVSAEKVDDLLAQMAGEEIDRLLSDAESPRESAPQPASPAASDQPVVQQLDALFSAPQEPPAAARPTRSTMPVAEVKPAAPAPSEAAVGDDEVSKQLNDLFSDTEPSGEAPKGDSASTAAALTADTPAPVAATMPRVAEATGDSVPTIDPSLEIEASTTSEERAALTAMESAPADPEDPLGLQLPEGGDEGRGLADVAIKPLEWMNTPWGGVPDQFRDLVGKIALLTLFNATAVLIYVFLFRHHH